MTDSLKVFFSDVVTATFLNLSRGIMPGYCNQSVTFALNNDSSKTPPVLLTIWEGSPDSSGKRSSEWIYMDPDDARSIAHVLIAYADAWQDRWDRFESGEDTEVAND